jgi:hypothetical protein
MGETALRILLALLAFAAFAATPGRAADDYNYISFSQPLKLSRGHVFSKWPGAAYLSHDDTCRSVVEQGWSPDYCRIVDNVLVTPAPGIARALIYKPVDEGYIRFDDWAQSKEQIDSIWASFVDETKEQGQRLNQKLVPEGWLVYPTLDTSKAYMYYAVVIDWNGRRTINIKGSLFDRSGFVPFLIVPASGTLPGSQVQSMVTRFLASYTSDPDSSYFDFKPGDKVAAFGVASVLAALLGVKAAKVAAVGLFAVALAFGKKLLFLLLVAPFLALKRMFARRRPSPPPLPPVGVEPVEKRDPS